MHYNPETGVFTWRIKKSGNTKAGCVAGSLRTIGYITIHVDNIDYKAHRLAFLYMEGYFPELFLDHINRIKNDNRWDNLREVSPSCNQRNTGINKNNTSGVKGVFWFPDSKKWVSRIKVFGKLNHLGYFENFNDAVKARWEAEVKYEFPNCNSTSSAYQYLVEHNLL